MNAVQLSGDKLLSRGVKELDVAVRKIIVNGDYVEKEVDLWPMKCANKSVS